MFDGLKKAITFSYDDGITQDKRLIEILNKYNLKATFNLNSGTFATASSFVREGATVSFVRPTAEEIKGIYKGHEIAAHTLTHEDLTKSTDSEIICQVETDRMALSSLAEYEVVGMAYPYGKNDERTENIIRKSTGVKYSRTVTNTYDFRLQSNLLRFNPTVFHLEKDKMTELAEQFLSLKTEEPKLFYIWGHSFEFDINNDWQWFDDFCHFISNRKDVFYGTNKQIFKL